MLIIWFNIFDKEFVLQIDIHNGEDSLLQFTIIQLKCSSVHKEAISKHIIATQSHKSYKE